MTSADTIREALAKLTPGVWNYVFGSAIVSSSCSNTPICSIYRDENAQGIVTLINTLPALLAEHEAVATEMNRLAAELACTKLDVAGCEYSEADLEQAERAAFQAGFLATVPMSGEPRWMFDGPSAADREPEAWAAWRERRAAERNT